MKFQTTRPQNATFPVSPLAHYLTHGSLTTNQRPECLGGAQSVEGPTSAQVMISRFVGSSSASGSVLTAQSLEPCLRVCVSLSLCPSPARALSLSLSVKNKQTFKERKTKNHKPQLQQRPCGRQGDTARCGEMLSVRLEGPELLGLYSLLGWGGQGGPEVGPAPKQPQEMCAADWEPHARHWQSRGGA